MGASEDVSASWEWSSAVDFVVGPWYICSTAELCRLMPWRSCLLSCLATLMDSSQRLGGALSGYFREFGHFCVMKVLEIWEQPLRGDS